MGRVRATFHMTDEVAREMLSRGVRPWGGGGEFETASEAYARAREAADIIGFPVLCRIGTTERKFFPRALREAGYR